MDYIPDPYPLTRQQINALRARYSDGEKCIDLAEEIGVKIGWLYHRVRDIKKYRVIRKPPKAVKMKKIQLPDATWTIREMRTKCPHFLLYLFASGQLDDKQMNQITTLSTKLEAELNEVSQGKCLSEVVRDHPLLLLRTMVRLETWDPQRCNPRNHRRHPEVDTGKLDPYKMVGQVDQDHFDPESEIMRNIARLAMGFALK